MLEGTKVPLYRFLCKDCEQKFTQLVSIGKETEVKCETCGSSKLEKLIPRSITGRTKEGALSGMSSCSTCQATSCRSCSQ
ncbi:zinc ribbon domain-containing protein [Candidatus Aerophobetes bacterium]|uniref:Zinc ribbon domain-containing protein n=1 Tax=Aerophobetes bacterium TaxID=2030807 RepID=A0A523W817_UNCAE|nr:MAG: zinc ribbon domain-containing protein [Candidatus Aerophobetes bacterium]